MYLINFYNSLIEFIESRKKLIKTTQANLLHDKVFNLYSCRKFNSL